MKKISLIIKELCFIVIGFFAINYLIENVLDPDFTVNWKVYPSSDAIPYAQEKGTFSTTQEYKDSLLSEIMGRRQANRFGLFFSFGLLIAAYYCDKAARSEIKRRGEIIPEDGTETLDYYTIQSNRRIVLMRFVSILMVMGFIILATIIIIADPMNRNDAAGELLWNPNPYCTKDQTIGGFLFIFFMPIGLLVAPHFALRKISNIYSLKYSLTLFAGMMVFAIISILLHISPIIAASIASASGLFASYTGKMNRIAKILGM